MSASPYFYIEMYNLKTGNWDKVDIYTKDSNGEYNSIDLWPWNGTHEVFSILEYEHSYDFPEVVGIHSGLPVNVSEEVKQIYEKWNEFKPSPSWYNLADLKLYFNKYPKVKDYDAIWEEDIPVYKDNPIKAFIDRVESFLDIWDDYWNILHSYSDVRIVGWVSW